ncbi:MAG: 16S rRNA (guanine(966)-N(2))-methyltransferase RsmD [Mycobacteriales bacterium]
MTRILAGRAGGRTLTTPPGSATRPTAGRVRDALFTSVAGRMELPGADVVDLYAGSGALGLEAMSRGASTALLVESGRAALRAIRMNVAALGLPAVTVCPMPVERAVESARWRRPVDLVLADPPYDIDPQSLTRVLGLVAASWLRPGGLVVLERSARDPEWVWPESLEPLAQRSYGDTALWYGRRP